MSSSLSKTTMASKDKATSSPPPTVAAKLTATPSRPSPAPEEPKPDTRKTPAPSSRAPSAAPEPTPEPASETVNEEEADEADAADAIDMDTFNQILDLDEDDTHEFSRDMVWAYFTQANTTFTEMDEAFEKKDLIKLSSLGHFLKGSSAALGVAKVQASCEQIQHFGQLRDEDANADLVPADALAKIDPLLVQVKKEYVVAERWLKDWYRENGDAKDDD